MNFKQFEYVKKDIKNVKGDTAFRMFFFILFMATFFSQVALIFFDKSKVEMKTLDYILSSLCLFFMVLFAFLALVYSLKNIKIVNSIKNYGKFEERVTLIFSTEKRSFLMLYSFITDILAVLSMLVLTVIITYSALDYAYFTTISFYLPFLISMCLVAIFSAHHIKHEIYIMKNLRQFHSI